MSVFVKDKFLLERSLFLEIIVEVLIHSHEIFSGVGLFEHCVRHCVERAWLGVFGPDQVSQVAAIWLWDYGP